MSIPWSRPIFRIFCGNKGLSKIWLRLAGLQQQQQQQQQQQSLFVPRNYTELH